jgi:hypothetical protein
LQTHVVGLQTLNFNVSDVEFSLLQTCDVWVSRRRGSSWCWILHTTWVVVLMMLQHFVSCVLSTLTCCDICILMFRCDLANVADVEFRCCRHLMLGVVSRRRGGRAPDVGCCTQHRSQHGRNIVATWSQHVGEVEERRPMLDVARNLVRNMLGTRATHSQHPSLNVARTTVRNMGKNSSQHRKGFSQHSLRLATRSTADRLPSSESCGPAPVRC